MDRKTVTRVPSQYADKFKELGHTILKKESKISWIQLNNKWQKKKRQSTSLEDSYILDEKGIPVFSLSEKGSFWDEWVGGCWIENEEQRKEALEDIAKYESQTK